MYEICAKNIFGRKIYVCSMFSCVHSFRDLCVCTHSLEEILVTGPTPLKNKRYVPGTGAPNLTKRSHNWWGRTIFNPRSGKSVLKGFQETSGKAKTLRAIWTSFFNICFVLYWSFQCRLNHGPNGPLARAPELPGSGNFILLSLGVKILIGFLALIWLYSTSLPFKIIFRFSTINVVIINSIIEFGVTMSPTRIIMIHIIYIAFFHSKNICSCMRSGFQCPSWS